ncbi:Hydrocephalus-inducing protein like protein, related [Eimeria necatrix]|uniref:Hydrocephalus-inducing protein like protein, related n=1 Tax=Eimeria necatrix TaxID=51315 RepID=U6MPG9_9EIME|nr:Hydrocephalus-inducing protein like protein, related [Eimeria necatrix]CDJ63525.1 Hydrocephalus-inducing protein like protein, related [Eimeria necatrix]
MKNLGDEDSFFLSSVRENAVENEEHQLSCGPTKMVSFKNKIQHLGNTGVNTCTASRSKGNSDCENCAAPQAMSPQKIEQFLSHAGAGMLDALTSAKIFRLLLPSVPSLQPLFHKVVAVAERNELFGQSAIPIGSPLFEALPPAVFFVGFEAAKVYHAAFKLRNKDRISRRVLALTPDSLHFSVTAMKEEKASTARETFLVPLRAFQGLCSLNIPPVVSLETAIVGKRKEKTMFLTNNGNADSNVTLLVSPPFEVQPGCFPIPIGGSQQGREEVKQLECTVVEAAVTLSTSLLKFDTTFVNLTSERSLCIQNNSNEHLPFRWSFGASEERLEEFDEILETVSSGSFAIKPASGRVWANSTLHIRVQFTPIQATTYNSTAILNIIGREKSLKMQLCGTGTGPQAKFTKAELDFGDVAVYTNKTLDVEIVNTGDIAATYLVKPLVGLFPAGTEINFIPSGGCISINKAERVQISLKPAFVGEFEVVVPWAIESSPEDILLKLKGRAIPPQINFDVSCVDFGIIPFGFEEVRSITLENTSSATQMVNAKVVKRTDDTYCDIKISPDVLTIPAGALGSFNVILCPSKAQTYLEEVAFGLPGLIEDYLTLPLRGSSKTPHVALEPDSSLVLEDVFIHTAATKSFTIRNTSRLSAQFTVTLEVRLYNVEKGVASLFALNSSTISGDTKTGRHSHCEFGGEHVNARAAPSKGLVPPLSEVSVLIIFYPTAPGDINFNCLVHIAGLDTPFQLEVHACASGPKLKIEPKELQWGKIKCLDEVIQQVEVTNTSPIPASIRCCIRSKHGYFTAKNPEMTLNGGASAAIFIVAMFREAVAATGQLTVSAVDGQSFIVYLKGQAVGSPVVLEDFGPCTDFQQVCTSNAKRKTFKVFNRGSRMRHIHFLDGSRSAYSRQTPESQRKFMVQPNEFPLGPDSSMQVVIEALSTFPGRASQVIICQESLGAGTTPVRVARTLATADFFTPNLVATPSSLSFK